MPRKKRTVKKRSKQEGPKASLKEKMSELFEIPKDIVLNVPKLTMIGNGDLLIENFKGIIEYDDDRIRINTNSGIIKISGTRLGIKEITSEDLMVNGEISSLEFLK
ncbi:sporulation protein YqfC [Acetivibrio cellulolyticus]|uniref:sporulation protein YqfC n=1 Tax=Acetivibrio cellulolyticus TaxID=35830 RepID=UPI0001E2E2BD|nr:sporulation protein YqfC [Acetivibrio cellulolyticus]